MKVKLKKLTIFNSLFLYKFFKNIPYNENGSINYASGRTFKSYKNWVEENLKRSNFKYEVNGFVPQTIYILYINNKPVGVSKIRPLMNENTLEWGGNIGYNIIKEYRGLGYGNIILKESLSICKDIGLDKVLLTIKKRNEASMKIAFKNGAILEKEVDGNCYLWINLT